MAAAFARKSRIICLFPNYFCTFSTVVPKDCHFLIEKYQFSQETASKVSSFSKNPQRTHSVLEFLKQTGFSNSQLEKIARFDHRLVSSRLVKTIESKIKTFEDLGFSAVEIVQIVTNHPSILKCSMTRTIIPSLSVLKGLVGSNAQVAKVLTRQGWVMRLDFKQALLPNIEFLKSCGVAEEQINSLLLIFPNFFMLTTKNMRRCVDKVDEMGVERSSRLFIYAVKVVSSMTDANWELKLKTFRDLGFSEDDIVRVFRSDPVAFLVSRQKIRQVKEVLLETGKYDLSCILKCPCSLMSSVEKRYKPRLRILKDLEKRGLISKWPGLGTLRTMTDDDFFMKFVSLGGNEVRKD